MHELIWVLIVGFGLLAAAKLVAYIVVAALVVFENRHNEWVVAILKLATLVAAAIVMEKVLS